MDIRKAFYHCVSLIHVITPNPDFYIKLYWKRKYIYIYIHIYIYININVKTLFFDFAKFLDLGKHHYYEKLIGTWVLII